MTAKKTVVFPTDFSTTSDAALRHATLIARDKGATLLIVHVSEPPAVYGVGDMYYGLPDPDSADQTRMLLNIVPTDPQVPCDHRLLTGDPATEIVRLATDEGAELIVMGTHGRTGLGRMLMGSVAEAVVRRAKCPVLTLKDGSSVPATEQAPSA